MTKYVLVIFIHLLLITNLFAQDSTTWFIGKPIQKFSYSGLEVVSAGTLDNILKNYIGMPFSYDLYYEIQNRLYALEYFESIAADAEPVDETKSAVTIHFTLKEYPIINEIKFEGAYKVGEGELRQAILLKPGDVVTDAKIRVDAEAVKALYLEKGYLDATASGRKEIDKEKNIVRVVFTVKEGFQTTIKKIMFQGISFATEGTLKNIMQLKEPAVFVNPIFKENMLADDIVAIEEYYANNGYFLAKVEKVDKSIEEVADEGRKYLVLTFYITEGDQYTFGGVTFKGNNIFSTERLNSLMKLKAGDIFNRKKFKESFAEVTGLYYNQGYVTTQFLPNEQIDKEKKSISFIVTIYEGDVSHIENIIIQGYKKTKEYVIRRELPFEEGDIFNVEKIRAGIINLHRLGYFTPNILVDTPQGSAPGLMDIIITVEDTNTAQFEVGGSFVPSEFPFSAYAKIYDSNFLGTGNTFGVNAVVAPLDQSISVEYTENWLFGYRIMAGADISFSHRIITGVLTDSMSPIFTGNEDNAVPDPFTGEWVDADTGVQVDNPTQQQIDDGDVITDYEYALLHDNVDISNYTMEYHSLDFTVGVKTGYRLPTSFGLLGVITRLSTGVEYTIYDDALFRPFDATLRNDFDTWVWVNRWGTSFYLDNRDFPYSPSSGYYLAQYFGFTGGFLFGDRHYTKLTSTAEGYLTLFNIPVFEGWNFKYVLAAHSQLSLFLPPLGGDLTYLEDDLFYIDGMIVGRGWNLMDIRGKALWDNRIELRSPIFEQYLWWTWFFDATAIFDEIEEMGRMRLDDFYFTLGCGLRLTIPGIPIRFYLAKRFRVVEGVVEWEEGRFRFGDEDSFSFELIFAIGADTF
ncbi:MAG: outer membrane protein assembly factor BamA [Spirochaetales bacterium]|nr:outer membrane protein assembly factor BamA [Spirochaetales bacterium]